MRAARSLVLLAAAAAASVGLYGAWVVNTAHYTHGPDMRIVRTITTVTGPDAVSWGWRVVCGSTAVLAWLVVAFPWEKPRWAAAAAILTALGAIAADLALRPIETWPFRLWAASLVVFHLAALAVVWRSPRSAL